MENYHTDAMVAPTLVSICCPVMAVELDWDGRGEGG